ncbi:MAG: hypothetical protein KAS36_03235 [Anaerolineales bacterium]|nr:hypothetical protein [Anaerolineales bacterium]
MTADAWKAFDVFYDQVGNEAHDLNATDVIKMALILNTWTPNLQTDVSFSVVDAFEHAALYGYTAGGDAVAATWDAATNTLTFDVANNIWSASGGSILARYALLYNSSAPGSINDLIAYCLMDNLPADVEATDGNTLTVTVNASGVFTITQS